MKVSVGKLLRHNASVLTNSFHISTIAYRALNELPENETWVTNAGGTRLKIL